MLTDSPTLYECLEILTQPLLHKSLFVVGGVTFSTALSHHTIVGISYKLCNGDNKCGMPRMHSSQNPKPPRRVLVEVGEHIHTSDSRKLFSFQFVILLWTSENFCLLAQLLPNSWSFSSKDIDQSGDTNSHSK